MPAQATVRARPRLPAELINIGGSAAGLAAVVASGAALSSVLPATVWFTASAYGAPAAVAFVAYCCIARRVRR